MKIKINKDSLYEHLKEQLSFIHRSAKAFDEGFEEESKRMAVALRILFHDTKNSSSLLRQLGIKNSYLYRDTYKYHFTPNISGPIEGLTGFCIKADGTANAYPLLDNLPIENNLLRSFENWWNQQVIRDNLNSVFTRCNLVLNIADTDGGAHVDPRLDCEYEKFVKQNSMEWWVIDNGNKKPIGAPHLASIRQIVHELFSSLFQVYPEFKNDANIEIDTNKKVEFAKIPIEKNCLGRNELCPCGSGLKFKKCHISTQSNYNLRKNNIKKSTISCATPTSFMLKKS
ncbi:hypothetical protein EPN96_01020 [bacterium]|nr:MAG: hypothetical protein EPN96_01020 [bacterium]